jgi:hypothetical protein
MWSMKYSLYAGHGRSVLFTLFAAFLWVSSCCSQTTAGSSNGFGMLASPRSASPAAKEDSIQLTSLKFSESSVTGGGSSEITLTVSQAAPAGGMKVTLSASEADVLQLPPAIDFQEGQRSLIIPVVTDTVPAAVSVTVQAHLGNSIVGANLLVLPATSAPFTVTAPASVTVRQGKSGTATVTTTVSSGFDEALQLKASGEPGGVRLKFDPKTIPAPGSGNSKLSIGVASRVQTKSYPLTITASDGTASASAKTTLHVISGTTSPDATFKGCWYKQGSDGYQAVDVEVGKPGSYPFNAVLYYGSTCAANEVADQFGFGQLLDLGSAEYTFWFTAFANQPDMSALWYLGDENSKCVSYSSAPDC